jgi:L-ascorbate metabolism protein UlaG (beta-lactamase superfamily)
MKWKMGKNPQQKEKDADTFRLKVIPNNTFSSSKEDMIVWFGHASFFIRLGGHTIVTDPLFSNVFLLKRLAAMPCKIEDIKGVEYLLLSHNHRDHMDKASIKSLAKVNPQMEALLPLKLGKVLGNIVARKQEAGWFQEYKLNNELKIFLMPAKHWSKRGMFDTKTTLWGSFIIQYKETTIFFAGDCAFNEENIQEIKKYFPNITYALMPIGAYKPPYIMDRAHMSPTRSVEFFNLLGAKVFIPMHYATLDLSDEPIGEPFREMQRLEKEGKILGTLHILNVGEELKIK